MKACFTAFLLCISIAVTAQFKNTSSKFVQHLLNRKMYEEAVLVMQEKLSETTLQSSKDSLHLQLGKAYYSLQQLPASILNLDLVSGNNEQLFTHARFFSAFNEAYLHNTDTAIRKLVRWHGSNERWKQLQVFELSGMYLLKNNFHRFDSLRSLSKRDWPLIQQQENNFPVYRNQLVTLKKKSPLMAGIMSTVIPGAGKFYAGRKGNGIYTLLITALLGAQTYEAYKKNGVESARFIIYGSLFTAFYVGNIWGSTLAVNVVRNEKRDAIHHQILFDMHIPLRTIFQ